LFINGIWTDIACFDCHAATLNCQRLQAKQGSYQLVAIDLLGSNTQEIQLAALRGAKVEKKC
jgi:hypothetical protein